MQMIGRLQAKFLRYGEKCGAARLCAALVLFVVLTQLLHLAGQVPLIFPNQRAPDFGYGHYNGFAGRLFGLYTAALLLLYRRFAPWGWAIDGRRAGRSLSADHFGHAALLQSGVSLLGGTPVDMMYLRNLLY